MFGFRDEKGRPPYVVAGSKETRNEFRRFMASFPDRYDYVKAQVQEDHRPPAQVHVAYDLSSPF